MICFAWQRMPDLRNGLCDGGEAARNGGDNEIVRIAARFESLP